MKKIKDKILDKTLSPDDVDMIIQNLQEIIKKKTRGHNNFSEDDIKQLKVLQFLLKFYNQSDVNFSIQDERYERIANILDELELNKIITKPLTALGGLFQFRILDRVRYRDYIYKLIELIIEKFPKEDYLAFLKKIDLDNQYIVGIIVTVIGGILLYLILKYEKFF